MRQRDFDGHKPSAGVSRWPFDGSSRAEESGNDAGYSLVELIVYIVLLGIISAIVASVVTISFQTQRTVAATSDTANSVQTFSGTFYRDVRNSRSAVVSALGDSVTLCKVTTQGAAIWREVTWKFNGDKLTRAEGGATDAVLYGGVTGAKTFSVFGRDVKYDFTFAEKGTAARQVEGAIRLGPVNSQFISHPGYPDDGKVICLP